MWDGARFGFDYCVNLRKLLNGCNGVSENTGWCEDADMDYVPGYVWKWEFWFDALVFHGIWWRQMNSFDYEFGH